MKKCVITCAFTLLSVVCTKAQKIPADILDANVALAFYEYNTNENIETDFKEIQQALIDNGLNVVSAHQVTNRYDAAVALADMNGKDVKYIARVLYYTIQSPIYYINIYERANLTDETFEKAEKKSFLIKNADTAQKLGLKIKQCLMDYQNKHDLSNAQVYHSSLLDTTIIKPEDQAILQFLNNKRNFVMTGNTPYLHQLPEDLSACKVAFVKCDAMDAQHAATTINSIIETQLKDYQFNCEIFDSYEAYLQRKDEFKYRVLFSSQKMTNIESRNQNPAPFTYKNGLTQTDKELISVMLRDETSGAVYQCTDCDWLDESTRSFVAQANKKR